MLKINFSKLKGLIPTIIQENNSGEILMLGYMNKEAFNKTRKEGFVYFWSRSRGKLWKKGETSGNFLKVKKIFADCDRDTLLIKTELIGSTTCHRGTKSCFADSLELRSSDNLMNGEL